jgi:hypothetical protein
MILIYAALQCEVQGIIEHYKLLKTSSNPKIYSNERMLVVIGGVGKENTLNHLEYIYSNYSITRTINIGIVGASNKNIPIGSIYNCTNNTNILPYKKLITVDKEVTNNDISDDILIDMEGEYFLNYSLRYLSSSNVFIIKIVSDHLESLKLTKDEIKNIILKYRKKIETFLR